MWCNATLLLLHNWCEPLVCTQNVNAVLQKEIALPEWDEESLSTFLTSNWFYIPLPCMAKKSTSATWKRKANWSNKFHWIFWSVALGKGSPIPSHRILSQKGFVLGLKQQMIVTVTQFSCSSFRGNKNDLSWMKKIVLTASLLHSVHTKKRVAQRSMQHICFLGRETKNPGFYESFIHIIKRTYEDKSMINASGNNKLVKYCRAPPSAYLTAMPFTTEFYGCLLSATISPPLHLYLFSTFLTYSVINHSKSRVSNQLSNFWTLFSVTKKVLLNKC